MSLIKFLRRAVIKTMMAVLMVYNTHKKEGTFMKSKILIIASTAALLASCGTQEISFESFKNVSQEILNVITSDDFKAPTKLTANISITDDDQKGTIKFIADDDNNYLYVYESVEKKNEDPIVYEVWSYAEGTNYIIATAVSEKGKTSKYYYTSPRPYNAENSISSYLEFEEDFLATMVEIETEEFYDEIERATFKSKGKGSIICEAKGKNGEYGYFEFSNNLIVTNNIKGENREESMTFKWGEANFKKPNLKDFEKVGRE